MHAGAVLIEAINSGGKLSSVLGRAARARASIKLLRLKNPGALDQAQLADVAKSNLHKHYSPKGAWLTQVAGAELNRQQLNSGPAPEPKKNR